MLRHVPISGVMRMAVFLSYPLLRTVIELHNLGQSRDVAGLLAELSYQVQRVSGPAILNPHSGWSGPHGVWGTLLASKYA